MILHHEHKYPKHTQEARLNACDLTPLRYRRMCRSADLRRTRESAIPQEDVDAVIDLIAKHPQIGSVKVHHTLIDHEQAFVSSAFINQAKQEMIRITEMAYRSRREKKKTLEQLLRERQAPNDYQHIQAEYPNHIWATDFLNLRFLGFSLCICVVYDIFTQAYHSILAGAGSDRELAGRCLSDAVRHNGGQAAVLLRRDNGKAFTTHTIQSLLDHLFMQDNPIPPASPWFNGSLESNNSGLKATVKTIGLQQLAADPARFRLARANETNAVAALQQLCNEAFISLNSDISRPKFAMPPQQVMNGNQKPARQRHQAFKERRKQERKERMKAIRRNAFKTGYKSFMAKARLAIRRKLRSISTDELFAFNESTHGRFEAIEL